MLPPKETAPSKKSLFSQCYPKKVTFFLMLPPKNDLFFNVTPLSLKRDGPTLPGDFSF